MTEVNYDAILRGIAATASHARFAQPFAFTIDGVEHACATDAHVLLMVPHLGAAYAANTAPANVQVVLDLRPKGEPRRLRWPDLLAHCAVTPGGPVEPCAECDSTGRLTCETCDGSGLTECICYKCEDLHDADCEACDGEGWTPCPCGRERPTELRHRRIGVKVYNGALLWLARSLPADVVEWRDGPKEGDMALITAPEWSLAIMPMAEHVNEAHRTLKGFDGWLEDAAAATTEARPDA